jgi:hypothetical protein
VGDSLPPEMTAPKQRSVRQEMRQASCVLERQTANFGIAPFSSGGGTAPGISCFSEGVEIASAQLLER